MATLAYHTPKRPPNLSRARFDIGRFGGMVAETAGKYNSRFGMAASGLVGARLHQWGERRILPTGE